MVEAAGAVLTAFTANKRGVRIAPSLGVRADSCFVGLVKSMKGTYDPSRDADDAPELTVRATGISERDWWRIVVPELSRVCDLSGAVAEDISWTVPKKLGEFVVGGPRGAVRKARAAMGKCQPPGNLKFIDS
jgi:hypothetical protein